MNKKGAFLKKLVFHPQNRDVQTHLLVLGLAWMVLVAFILNPTSVLFGQERFGSINGVIKDSSGALVPGATITVTNKETNRSLTTESGNDGAYYARDLEPGRYSLRVEMAGFAKYEFPDINRG